MKKVLVISYLALSDTTPNGRTMKSLLQGVGKENIISLFVSGNSDNDACSSAYKIPNRNMVKSMFTFKESGNVSELKEPSKNGFSSEYARIGKKKAWKYLLREIAWKFGHWNGSRLKHWLKEQAPDCIVYMYGDSPSLQNISVAISKLLNIPLIVYSCENYCFKKYNYLTGKKFSPAFSIYSRMSNKATKKLFDQASALICNSDELGELYKAHYPIKLVRTITMASNIETEINVNVRSIEDTRIVFLGALGYYRINALITIANALAKIDPKLKLDVYGKLNDKEALAKFEACESLRYNGFVSYEEVQKIIKNAALNLEVISLNPIIERNKQFGLSTKFADGLRCGTPFLLYAPPKMVETVIAQKHECAFVVTNNSELENTLRTALFDQTARETQVECALKTSAELFDHDKNISTFNYVLDAVISSHKELSDQNDEKK